MIHRFSFLIIFVGCGVGRAQLAAEPRLAAASPSQSTSLENLPPLVSGGPDQEAQRGTTVMLDGRGSFHPLYHPLIASAQVQWSQLGGTQAVTLSNPTDLLTSFVAPPDNDTLTFQLLITADNGRQASQQVIVHVVTGVTAAAPIVAVDGDRSLSVGEAFSLSATTSADSPAVVWTQNAGAQMTVTHTATKLTGTATGADVLVFSARATAANGLQSAPDYAVIVVTAAGGTPTVADSPATGGTTTVPLNDITAAPGASVTLSVPGGGTVAGTNEATENAAAFVQLAGEAVMLDNANSFIAPNHLARLVFAYYAASENLRSAPELFTVNVTDPTLSALSASAGPDRLSHPGGTVVLDGTASVVGDATPVWTQTLGPQVKLDLTNALVPTFVAPSESSELSFTLQLQSSVNDHATFTAPSTVVVRVRPLTLNDPPLITLSESATATDVKPYALTATAIDPEGDAIASLLWTVDASSATAGQFASPQALTTTFTATTAARPAVVAFTACDILGACATKTLTLPR